MPSTSAVGGAKAKKVNNYALLVKEVTQQNKMKLPEASKYIKEQGLYKTAKGAVWLVHDLKKHE